MKSKNIKIPGEAKKSPVKRGMDEWATQSTKKMKDGVFVLHIQI